MRTVKLSHLATALVCLSAGLSPYLSATELSPANPVLRSLVLMDDEMLTSVSAIYGDLEFGEDDWQANLYAAYGLTDNITIETLGIRYRFKDRPTETQGLEMTIGAGYRGELKSRIFGDTVGAGVDITGKYIFNEDAAMTFGVGYIHWDEDIRENRHEIDYSLGFQKNLFDDFTLMANYTHRDLDGFVQSNAYNYQVGVNYNLDRDLDVGVFYADTNFKFWENFYDIDKHLTDGYGVYVNYRF